MYIIVKKKKKFIHFLQYILPVPIPITIGITMMKNVPRLLSAGQLAADN